MYASIHPFHVTNLHEVQILGDISQAIFLLKGNDGVLIALFSHVFVTERKKSNSFRSVLFRDVMQRIIVILRRHFGATYWSDQVSRNCS